MLRKYRKPLIIVGPKILLRHPQAVSTMDEMGPNTKFQPVLGDKTIIAAEKVERVVVMSGKLYYDLVKRRNDLKKNENVAIIRLEELAPFPTSDIQQELARYSNAKGKSVVHIVLYQYLL
jgi:probable 2-oxoglutarate dehydrogenase E1 component DHKTD1